MLQPAYQLALYSCLTIGTMATGDGGQTEAQLMLAAVQCAAQPLLDRIEEHTEMPVTFSETPKHLAIENGSFKWYAIKMRFLRQIPNSNGLEVWHQLHSLYVPRTKVKNMAII